MKKLHLRLDALEVDSFATTTGARAAAVRAHADTLAECEPTTPPADLDVCTCADSCLCPTAAYWCATAPATVVSCGYTLNQSCVYDTELLNREMR